MMIVVFLGPSLSIDDAKKILSDAIYLPPAAAGDILHVTRLKPDIIAIIDGFFEKKASILHKEILFAMELGISVYGASSMGALRARECKSFGMVGIGKIYEKYFLDYNEDDLVAILHGSAVDGYAPKTLALVDIISTLEKAVSENIIDDETARAILQSAKTLFYIYRTLENIFINEKYASAFSNFKKWILKNGWINQKKQDAISLLQYLSTNPKKPKMNISVERSLFFRTHYKNAMCKPFHFYHEALPIEEKIAIYIKNEGVLYRQLQRISYLLALCFTLAKKNMLNVDWARVNNARKRFNIIEAFMHQQNLSSHFYIYYLHSLMRLSSEKEYQYYRSQVLSQEKVVERFLAESPMKYRIFELCAKLWGLVEHFISHFTPHPKFVQIYSDKFRLKQQLFTAHDTNVWLRQNDLDVKEYQDLMIRGARLNHVVLQNNVEVLGLIDCEENIWWFLDAMQLSGIYDAMLKRLKNNDE